MDRSCTHSVLKKKKPATSQLITPPQQVLIYRERPANHGEHCYRAIFPVRGSVLVRVSVLMPLLQGGTRTVNLGDPSVNECKYRMKSPVVHQRRYCETYSGWQPLAISEYSPRTTGKPLANIVIARPLSYRTYSTTLIPYPTVRVLVLVLPS